MTRLVFELSLSDDGSYRLQHPFFTLGKGTERRGRVGADLTFDELIEYIKPFWEETLKSCSEKETE